MEDQSRNGRRVTTLSRWHHIYFCVAHNMQCATSFFIIFTSLITEAKLLCLIFFICAVKYHYVFLFHAGTLGHLNACTLAHLYTCVSKLCNDSAELEGQRDQLKQDMEC